MSNILVKFDSDYNRPVVEVTDPKSGKVHKFVYNARNNSMVPRMIVKTSDVQLLYETPCERFGSIYFCRNLAKGGQVFKYIKSVTDRLQRVQCNCCTFNEEKVQLEVVLMSTFDFSSDEVNEDSTNYLHFRLLFSVFCAKQNQMVIFALVKPETEVLQRFTFDPSTEKFVKSTCTCVWCERPSKHFEEVQEFGAQDVIFGRTHRDKLGRALSCLFIDWYDQTNGLMNVFSNYKGHIAKYRFNAELDCFEEYEQLSVRVLPTKYHPVIKDKNPTMIFDDEIDFKYSKDCPMLGEKIFFGFHSGKIRKFIFNRLFIQFELVKCTDCHFDSTTALDFTGKILIFGIYLSYSVDAVIAVVRQYNGKITKRFRVKNGHFCILERSPVRYLKHLNPSELRARRHRSRLLISRVCHLAYIEETAELYQLSEALMVDMQGRIQRNLTDEFAMIRRLSFSTNQTPETSGQNSETEQFPGIDFQKWDEFSKNSLLSSLGVRENQEESSTEDKKPESFSPESELLDAELKEFTLDVDRASVCSLDGSWCLGLSPKEDDLESCSTARELTDDEDFDKDDC